MGCNHLKEDGFLGSGAVRNSFVSLLFPDLLEIGAEPVIIVGISHGN